jgi:hypothetical protein
LGCTELSVEIRRTVNRAVGLTFDAYFPIFQSVWREGQHDRARGMNQMVKWSTLIGQQFSRLFPFALRSAGMRGLAMLGFFGPVPTLDLSDL